MIGIGRSVWVWFYPNDVILTADNKKGIYLEVRVLQCWVVLVMFLRREKDTISHVQNVLHSHSFVLVFMRMGPPFD